MEIEHLSDDLLHDLDDATDDALGHAIAWAEAHGLDVHLHAVGEVRDAGVGWVLVVVAMHGERTVRWSEFPITDPRGNGPMRLLMMIELLGQLTNDRLRRTSGRPANAVDVVGTA